MQEGIAHHFTQQTLADRILAYTNNRVLEYNDHIRQLRQLPTEFTPGELLVNNAAIEMKRTMIRVEEEVEVIDVNDFTEFVEVGPNAQLEVRRVALKSRIGELLENVPLPVDRDHYRALMAYYKRVGANGGGWQSYYHLKNNYPDLRQRDSATVHKSQGSTYDHVFIDLGNISTCHQPNMVARMLYVAFSRARTRVFLYGNLAQKYGGLIG
jgi:hypothetical protein